MQKPFNQFGTQTYGSRKHELEEHANQIDEFLRKPPQPNMHFQPKGQLRPQSHSLAQDALVQKRVDILKELEDIKQTLAKRQQPEKSKTKSL